MDVGFLKGGQAERRGSCFGPNVKRPIYIMSQEGGRSAPGTEHKHRDSEAIGLTIGL